MRAILWRRGISPEEFASVFQKDYTAAGIKGLSNLVDPRCPDGPKYQGVLVVDHPRLQFTGILYELVTEVNVNANEIKLWHSDKCIAEQADRTYSELRRPSGGEDPDIKRIRLCSLTVDAIERELEASNQPLKLQRSAGDEVPLDALAEDGVEVEVIDKVAVMEEHRTYGFYWRGGPSSRRRRRGRRRWRQERCQQEDKGHRGRP